MLTYHADADTWVLEDLKSINGIFVNGKKVGRTRSPPSTLDLQLQPFVTMIADDDDDDDDDDGGVGFLSFCWRSVV
jgi:hypothetical protein